MKKNNLLINFLICWLGWGIPMGLLCSLMFGSLVKGLALGITGGILFAGIILAYIAILSARKDQLLKRYGIEGKVLYDGPANHIISKKAVGGWLFLMEDRLYFISHLFNRTVGQWSVPYSVIANAAHGNTIRSITIHLHHGEPQTFVVNDRNVWIELLNQKIISDLSTRQTHP